MIADDFKKPTLAGELPPEAWALVEILGHRSHWGRISECEQFGVKLLRVDIPKDRDSTEFDTRFYSGASIFSLTPCTEEYARQRNELYRAPVGLLSGPDAETRGLFDDEDDRA